MFLIIRNIFKIHVFFYVVMFVCLITGNIRDYLLFVSIVVVHEIGHITGGLIFSWKIKQVILLPFGGLTVFNNLVNTSLFEEFVVNLLGPVFQVIFYFFLSRFFVLSDWIVYYNFALLIFNLLPIYPLDGSKFLYVFLCLFFPFKCAHKCLVFISFLFIIFVFIYVGHFDLIIFLILFFLFFRVLNEYRNHDYIFNKFLFERYNYNFDFRCVRKVFFVNGMYLWCRHLFFVDSNYISERNFLKKWFDK